jgi:tetratricopeptide (TPR) repeat protein
MLKILTSLPLQKDKQANRDTGIYKSDHAPKVPLSLLLLSQTHASVVQYTNTTTNRRQRGTGMSKRLGLIIGLNHYQDAQFQPLQFAENDAKAFAQWLVNTQGGKWSPADVQLVQGTHATKELVEPLIAQLCLQNAEPDDLILIYFAGHAFVDERTGEGYLALANTSYENSASGLHLFSFAQQVLARSRASQIVLILDCSQMGRAWSMQRSSPYDSSPLLGSKLLNALPQLPNRLFLCSCRSNERSPETGERGLGLFAHRLIVGLCGPAIDPGTGTYTLPQLYSYLLGVLGDQQRPQVFGQGQLPFVLAGEAPSQQVPSLVMAAQPTQAMPMAQATTMSTPPTDSGIYTPPPMRSPQTSDLRTTSQEQQRQQQSQYFLQQAQQQTQAQLFGEALNFIEQALQAMPQNTAALTLKGQLLGMMGRMAEASTTIEQLLSIEPQNPLAWSMRAVVLNNIGQFQIAKEAIERSLELDPNNPESYAIRTNIMEGMAVAQSQQRAPGASSRNIADPQKRFAGFFLSILVQAVAFLAGIAGMGIMILKPTLTPLLGLGLASLGLALVSVWATRGSFRYGPVYLLPTLLLSLLAGGLVGALYKLGYTRILLTIQTHPNLLIPIISLAAWLALAAALPLPLALVGMISGMVARGRTRASLS